MMLMNGEIPEYIPQYNMMGWLVNPGMFPRTTTPEGYTKDDYGFVVEHTYAGSAAAEAGLRYLASELRQRGTLVYFEPESDADKKKFQKAVEVSDIVKFSHEKVADLSFVDHYTDKLFIRTMGAEGLEFNLCGQGWIKVAAVPNDNVVDWEGAGDWTTSAFLNALAEADCLRLSDMTEDVVRTALEKAQETASKSVSYMGSKGMIR